MRVKTSNGWFMSLGNTKRNWVWRKLLNLFNRYLCNFLCLLHSIFNPTTKNEREREREEQSRKDDDHISNFLSLVHKMIPMKSVFTFSFSFHSFSSSFPMERINFITERQISFHELIMNLRESIHDLRSPQLRFGFEGRERGEGTSELSANFFNCS